MAQITTMRKEDVENIHMICFDVDGVLVPRGTKIAREGQDLYLNIKKISPDLVHKIKQLAMSGYHVNISSGRSLFMLQEMFRDILQFVSITYENGSATYYRGGIYQHCNSFAYLTDISQRLLKVESPDIKGWEPKEHIITIHCEKQVPEIESIAKIYEEELYILWNGEAYDIGVKEKQTKGTGAKLLAKHFAFPEEGILAIGDNLNDEELLNAATIKVSADETRLKGDFYIPLEGELLPGEILTDKLLSLQ